MDFCFTGSGLEPGGHFVHEGTTLLSHQQLRGRLAGEVSMMIMMKTMMIMMIMIKTMMTMVMIMMKTRVMIMMMTMTITMMTSMTSMRESPATEGKTY